VTFNFAGSDQLATQITQGAPADVFASANKKQMDVVITAGDVVSGTERTLSNGTSAKSVCLLISCQRSSQILHIQERISMLRPRPTVVWRFADTSLRQFELKREPTKLLSFHRKVTERLSEVFGLSARSLKVNQIVYQLTNSFEILAAYGS
jgi:molybdenum ABC transporter molybdate-binding protein